MKINPNKGAINLLQNAMNVSAGDRVLIISEDCELGFYDDLAIDDIYQAGLSLSCKIEIAKIGFIDTLEELPSEIREKMKRVDHVLFQARLGDTLRFAVGQDNLTMSYAYDRELLGSGFCTIPHALMNQIYLSLFDELKQAGRWRITSNHGTDLTGDYQAETNKAFSIVRFPVCTLPPVNCSNANGVIVVEKLILSTGNKKYENDVLITDERLHVVIEQGRITRFEGKRADVEKINQHYNRVADLFNIDPFIVHSWHCGIHPKSFFTGNPSRNYSKWGASAFANTRYVHLHTCGDYAPGEICLSLFDASIQFADEYYWRNGDFVWLNRQSTRKMIANHGIDYEGFYRPDDIGIDYINKL